MVKNNIIRIILLLTVSFLLSSDYNANNILVKIGEKEILVSDFLKRAEYSPRPLYCRGNTELDKRIILNSLIGEKLFSMENDLTELPQKVNNYLDGRKKQKMREVFFNEISENSKMKIEDFSHWFDLSQVEYDIFYLSVFNDQAIENIINELNNGKNIREIFYQYSDGDIPTRKAVNIFNIDNRSIREKLFAKKFSSGDIIGPLLTDDNITMFIEIDKVGEKINLNPNSILQNYDEVESIINSHIAEKSYQLYTQDIMTNMSFTLNPDIYFDFVEFINTWYDEIDKTRKDDNHKPIKREIDLHAILLTLDGKEYSVSDIMDWIDLHPLVFRDGYYEKMDFSNQVKFALADLIRDMKVDLRAENIGLNNHRSVILEYEMWYDNYCALELRDEILGQDLQLNSLNVRDELNEYFLLLAQKYSDIIMINVDLLSSITISNIDMITYNKVGPYKFVVPPFPIITDHHQFDYGNAITMEVK